MKSIVIAGATCSGKSFLAERVCDYVGGIIVNADSMQVYEEFPILTAQPPILPQRHFLYSCISVHSPFNVALWLKKARDIEASYPDTPIVFVGGSGMYINALLNGIADIPNVPNIILEEANQKNTICMLDEMKEHLEVPSFIKTNDSQRIIRAWSVWKATGRSIWSFHEALPSNRHNYTVLLCEKDRANLYEDINNRCIEMWSAGILEEVSTFSEKNKNTHCAEKIIGFNEVLLVQNGGNKNQMIHQMQTRTRQYAKRQLTWFRNQLKPDIVLHSESKIEDILKKDK
jgi:tRNA dimethylallyltransferase